jgi:alanine racemase
MSSLVWVELDAGSPDHNLGEIRRSSGFKGLHCAVVKSNAYGHGVRETIPLLTGADWLAVNSLDEGLELREIGDKRPVLVLGYVPHNRLMEAKQADLRLMVSSFETLREIRNLPESEKALCLHMKIETGTWRQGVLPEDALSMAEEIAAMPGTVLDGIYTHFANIEDTLNHEYAEMQLERFEKVLSTLKQYGIAPPVVHTACTAAAILFPATHFSMIRTGIGLYGMWPSRETKLSAEASEVKVPQLKPVLSWKTRVVQIKKVPSGSDIGYGGTYRTTRDSAIAVLPVGYADGYRRSLSNTAWVLIDGSRAPVVGRICMNLCMVDVTDLSGVRIEDEVVLLGRSGDEEITAETMGQWMGTINYEVVSGISPLLPRIVKRGAEGVY